MVKFMRLWSVYLLATFKYPMLQDRAIEGKSACDMNLLTINTIRVTWKKGASEKRMSLKHGRDHDRCAAPSRVVLRVTEMQVSRGTKENI